MPPNDTPAVYSMEQALEAAPRVVKAILLGDINVWLRELQDAQEEDLAEVWADCRLVNMTAHFTAQMRYRGGICWTWQMRKEVRQVMGQGYYLLITDKHNFYNAGVREAQLHTYHCMVLAVFQGE